MADDKKYISLDPRMNRVQLPMQPEAFGGLGEMGHWQTYEVFHQKSRGEQHTHVGIVHAPNKEMALVFAKEQYARRMKCVNLWVVKTADVFASEYEDADMFVPGTDKAYREAYFYKTRELIRAYKEKHGLAVGVLEEDDAMEAHIPKEKRVVREREKPVQPKELAAGTIVKKKLKGRIIIGKKK